MIQIFGFLIVAFACLTLAGKWQRYYYNTTSKCWDLCEKCMIAFYIKKQVLYCWNADVIDVVA